MTLDEMIDEYASLKVTADSIAQDLEALRNQITQELESRGLNEYTSEQNNLAKLTSKTSIKYEDEIALIQYCKKNGLGFLISEKLNTSEFNKKLKSSEVLSESLQSYYKEIPSTSLSVKKV